MHRGGVTLAERDGPHWRAWRALRREERRRFLLRYKNEWLQTGKDVRWMLRGTRVEQAQEVRDAEAGIERQIDAALAGVSVRESEGHAGRRVPRLPTLDDYDRWRGDHPRDVPEATLDDLPLSNPMVLYGAWGKWRLRGRDR